MSRINFYLLVTIFFSINIYPQIESHVVFLPQGFSLQSLNASGTSNIWNEISNIGAVNPASNYKFRTVSAGVSYLFQTNLDHAYIAGIGEHRMNDFTPQSFGIVFPVSNLNLGLAMRQRYNGALDIGYIPVSTFEQPDGTGDYFNPIIKTKVNSYSFVLSYSFNNFYDNKNDLSLGFKLDYNRLHNYSELLSAYSNVVDYNFSWGIGAVYSITFDDNRSLQLGLDYESNVKFRKNFTYKNSSNYFITPNAPSRDSIYYAIVPSSFVLAGDIPGELKFDLNIDTGSKINLLAGVNYIFWNSIAENINNQIELSGSIIYTFDSEISSSFGFLSTGRKFKEILFVENDEIYAFFITAGLKFNLNYFDLNLSAADSHLISGELYKQTIGRVSLEFHL